MGTLPGSEAAYTRVNCRINTAIKRRAEEAAEILGQTITAFTETALAEKTEEVFSRFGSIKLSERDFRLFVQTINSARPPSAKLRKAAAAYKRLRAQNPESNW